MLTSTDSLIVAQEAAFGVSEINFSTLPGGMGTKVLQELAQPHQAL